MPLVTLESKHNWENCVWWEWRPVIQVNCDRPLCCSPPLIWASVIEGFEKEKESLDFGAACHRQPFNAKCHDNLYHGNINIIIITNNKSNACLQPSTYVGLSNVVQQIRSWTRNEDVWFLGLFLPNFVSTPCYFKLRVKILMHPGKVPWHVQVALMESTVKGCMKDNSGSENTKYLEIPFMVLPGHAKWSLWKSKQNYPEKTNLAYSHCLGFRCHRCPPRLHYPQVTTTPSAPVWV